MRSKNALLRVLAASNGMESAASDFIGRYDKPGTLFYLEPSRTAGVSAYTIGHNPASNHAIDPTEWAVAQRLIEGRDIRLHTGGGKLTVTGEVDGQHWFLVVGVGNDGRYSVRRLSRLRTAEKQRSKYLRNRHRTGTSIKVEE